MKYRRVATVMAGGSGERFWPLSRPDRPKQLLKLTDPNLTMLEEAVQRIEPVVGRGGVFVSIGKPIEDVVRQARVVSDENVLVEPLKRNTLGCLVWLTASLLAQENQSTSIAVVTADHKIESADVFRAAVERAFQVTEETGALGTIGISPTRPETGYGYIEADTSRPGVEGALWATRFREKPNLELAQEFLRAGNYYWNGGMFFWTLEAFLRELSQASPEAHRLTIEISKCLAAGDHVNAEQLFSDLPNQSIDYVLMEKASSVFIVPAEFPWDDVGAWDALERSLGTADEDGNVLQGKVVTIDSSGCIVYNDADASTVALLGLEDVIVVATGDAVLVCRKDMAQRVKEFASKLKSP